MKSLMNSVYFKKFFAGVVKKAVGAVLKIAHAEGVPPDKYSEYVYAAQENKDLQNLLPKTKFTLLNPLEVQVIFNKVEKEVLLFL